MTLSTVRLATDADKEWLLPLAESRPFPATLGVTAEMRRESMLNDYRNHWAALVNSPRLRLWVEPDKAFWLILHGEHDTLTGESQAVIVDHAGDPHSYSALLRCAGEEAENRKEEALVVRVFPELGPGVFPDLGFGAELARVAVLAQRQPDPDGFEVRRAVPDDKFFLTYLNALATQAYVPAGREGRRERVAFRNVQAYLRLDLQPESKMVGLILVHEGKDVGYVLLELGLTAEITNQPAAYFYDIVVDPTFHQRGAARALMNYCQNWLLDNGWPMLVGDISVNNQVAMYGATKIVGCQLEYERWGLGL